MTRPLVGFYVHYHGLGHKHRTEAILQHLQVEAAVVTSRIHNRPWCGPTLGEVLGLPCDIDAVPGEGEARARDVHALHYAPLWASNITTRVARYATWLDRRRPAVMVVDVSAEISMLTRLAGIPQIVVRQHGDRSDAAHSAAYEAAESLLAPFPQRMEDDITPDWVRAKTVYLDGFCRSTGEAPTRGDARRRLGLTPDRRIVVCMCGRGGGGVVVERVAAAARQTPGYLWLAVGPCGETLPQDLPVNLRLVGWVDEPGDYLRAADVVVTAAGHNSVMECGALGCHMIAIAEPRPFDEQRRKAYVLEREGLAVGLDQWPAPEAWPSLLRQAAILNARQWDAIFAGDGAQQAAQHIERVAERSLQTRTEAAAEPTSRQEPPIPLNSIKRSA